MSFDGTKAANAIDNTGSIASRRSRTARLHACRSVVALPGPVRKPVLARMSMAPCEGMRSTDKPNGWLAGWLVGYSTLVT